MKKNMKKTSLLREIIREFDAKQIIGGNDDGPPPAEEGGIIIAG